MTDPVPFSRGTDAEQQQWVDRAHELIDAGQLAIRALRRQDLVVMADGPCPRCEHGLNFRHQETIVAPDPGWLAGGSHFGRGHPPRRTQPDYEYREFDIACQCQDAHPGRGERYRGCGFVFRVNVPIS